jgi:hypothetical protein
MIYPATFHSRTATSISVARDIRFPKLSGASKYFDAPATENKSADSTMPSSAWRALRGFYDCRKQKSCDLFH